MTTTLDSIITRETGPDGALKGFPGERKRPGLRAAFARAAEDLRTQLEQRGVGMEPDRLAGLTVKLGKYLAKRQWDMAAIAGETATMADALAENPDALADPGVTLTKIMALHEDHNRQKAADVRRALLADPSADVPAPVMARSPCGGYKLVECLTRRHLQEETAALGHCAGGTHIEHYSGKMAGGDSRLFSLRTAKGVPVATIEYDTKAKTIVQIEGNPRKITGQEPFFRALCRTLHDLARQIEIGSIAGLPETGGKILTPEGTFTAFGADMDPDRVLAGTAIVDGSTPDNLLLTLCACPRLTLDVTNLDLSRLPAHVKSNLFSRADTFGAPRLRTAGNIDANNASSLNTPLLQSAGNIYADNASNLNMPQLQSAGSICADWTPNLDMPMLQNAGDIIADWALILNMPLLQTAKDICVKKAENINLPRLQKAEHIFARSAKSVNLPELEISEAISARDATTVVAPKHRNPEKISAPNAYPLHRTSLQSGSMQP